MKSPYMHTEDLETLIILVSHRCVRHQTKIATVYGILQTITKCTILGSRRVGAQRRESAVKILSQTAPIARGHPPGAKNCKIRKGKYKALNMTI